jgi:PKD repeat protein
LRTIQTCKNLTRTFAHTRLALLLALLFSAGSFARAKTPAAVTTPAGIYRLPVADTTPAVQAQFGYIPFTSCLPVTLQFIDTSITNGHTITGWQWDFGDGTTGTDPEPIHDYLVNGSYTVTYTISDDSGHTSTTSMPVAITTNTVYVNLGPDTSICLGNTLVLDAGPQASDVQYYWSTNDTSRTIQVTNTGDYWVQVYNATCSALAQLHISAKPGLTVDFAGNQADSCLPVTMHFNDQSEVCGGYIVYRRWDFDNGDSSLLQNPDHLFASGGNHTVRLTEKDDHGLEITTTKSIFINTNAGFVRLGNDTTICYGAPLILDAGSAAGHYTWNTGDTTRTIAIKEAGTYAVQATNNACIAWDSITIAAIFPFIPGFSSDVTSQCLPVAVRFTDSTQIVCGTAPMTGWTWDFGDSTRSVQQNPTHIYHKAGQFPVKLTVYDSLGVQASFVKDIIVTTIGPVAPILSDASICLGHNVEFDAGNEGAQYAWTPAASLSNDTIHNPQALPGISTLYKVQITKCGVTITDSVMVYVDSVARPVLQYDGAVLMAQPAVSYQWYKDNAIISGATARSYKPLMGGYYQVEISNTRGCYGRSANYFFLPEGVSIPGSKMKVKISPNPAAGELTSVLFSKVPGEAVEINVYDAVGRKVYSGHCSSVVNPIDCSHFYKGMYYVEVLTKGQKVVLPLQIL